jgi:Spy/CpxP family protein refolding chaperone
MRIYPFLFSTLLLGPVSLAQMPSAPPQDPSEGPAAIATAPPPRDHPHGPGERGGPMGHRGDMGKWWQNSELAKKLQLSDQQIKQLNDIFFEHRLKLIDYQADMEKQDLKLQAVLDEDSPSEGQVGSQVDQVLAARGKLEREFTMMNLSLRKVLSVEQWRQLKALREERHERDGFFGWRGPGGGPGPHPGAPPPPAPESPF